MNIVNKRKILKHKICKKYEEDIWGIFYKKQKKRNFKLKKLAFLIYLDNLNKLNLSFKKELLKYKTIYLNRFNKNYFILIKKNTKKKLYNKYNNNRYRYKYNKYNHKYRYKYKYNKHNKYNNKYNKYNNKYNKYNYNRYKYNKYNKYHKYYLNYKKKNRRYSNYKKLLSIFSYNKYNYKIIKRINYNKNFNNTKLNNKYDYLLKYNKYRYFNYYKKFKNQLKNNRNILKKLYLYNNLNKIKVRKKFNLIYFFFNSWNLRFKKILNFKKIKIKLKILIIKLKKIIKLKSLLFIRNIFKILLNREYINNININYKLLYKYHKLLNIYNLNDLLFQEFFINFSFIKIFWYNNNNMKDNKFNKNNKKYIIISKYKYANYFVNYSKRSIRKKLRRKKKKKKWNNFYNNLLINLSKCSKFIIYLNLNLDKFRDKYNSKYNEKDKKNKTSYNWNNYNLGLLSRTEYFFISFLKRKVINFFKRILRKRREIKNIYFIKTPTFHDNIFLDIENIKLRRKKKKNIYKSIYRFRMSNAWKFRKFYGYLSHKDLRTICKKVYNKRGDILLQFILLLEGRIDTILFRSNFVDSMFEARQWISHKKVVINNKVINKRYFVLKNKDILSILPKYKIIVKNKIIKNYINNTFNLHIPNYLEINYKVFSCIIIYDILKVNEVPYNFEFTGKDLNNLLYYYY